jgi:hypothetical protein
MNKKQGIISFSPETTALASEGFQRQLVGLTEALGTHSTANLPALPCQAKGEEFPSSNCS